MKQAIMRLIAGGVLMLSACSAQADDIIQIAPTEARDKAAAAEIFIVDVRTPQEWRQTGVAEGANLVTLQDPEFTSKVLALMEENKGKDVAFICRSGNRSMAAARMMEKATEAPIYNIMEGMVGQTSQTGWIDRGLPSQPCCS